MNFLEPDPNCPNCYGRGYTWEYEDLCDPDRPMGKEICECRINKNKDLDNRNFEGVTYENRN